MSLSGRNVDKTIKYSQSLEKNPNSVPHRLGSRTANFDNISKKTDPFDRYK